MTPGFEAAWDDFKRAVIENPPFRNWPASIALALGVVEALCAVAVGVFGLGSDPQWTAAVAAGVAVCSFLAAWRFGRSA